MLDRKVLFAERAAKCSTDLQQTLEFLQTVAAHAGDAVEAPTFEARGVGITHWAGGRRFCRFDPKFGRRAPHIFVFIPGASERSLAVVGDAGEQAGWVKIRDVRAAVRLVPLILDSYRRATAKVTKRRA